MPCYLRVYGEDLDVHTIAENTTLPLVSAFVKGERRSEASTRVNKRTGLNIEVSLAGFDEFDEQVSDAHDFLDEFKDELATLMAQPGIEETWFDFGVNGNRTGPIETRPHPASLLAAMGNLHIGLIHRRYAPTEG